MSTMVRVKGFLFKVSNGQRDFGPLGLGLGIWVFTESRF